MSLAIFATPRYTFQDDNGGPASGWLLYTYEPGTSTPKATYLDYLGAQANTNPVVLDARGEAVIYMDGAYKFVLTDAAGVVKRTEDNVTGVGDKVQSGYLQKNVAGSGNVALTHQEQNNSVIELTGALTGNINVTVDDDRDGYRWVVKNSTSGSYSITFKTVSGSGVIIAQGVTYGLYCNASSVVKEWVGMTAAGTAADKYLYTTAADTWAEGTIAANARAILAAGTVGSKDLTAIPNTAGTDTYTVTLGLTALVDGQQFTVHVLNANTIATPTINCDSLGAKTIVQRNGAAVPVGAIVGPCWFMYDQASDKMVSLSDPSASAADVVTGTSDAKFITPLSANTTLKVQSGVAVNTTSGVATDFANIPASVKSVTVLLNAVSTNGTSGAQIQLGTSGGIVSTGYAGAVQNTAAGSTPTTGFYVVPAGSAAATNSLTGSVTFARETVNTWVASGDVTVQPGGSSAVSSIAGAVTLAGELTTVRIATVNGTDLFDAGSANIFWEY